MYGKLRSNIVWAVFEVLGSSVTLFFLYRIIVRQLGVEALGIWSLVVATTSLGRFADIGATAGLGRFVAVSQAREDTSRTVAYVETAILTNFALYTVIALVIWAPAYYGLAAVMSKDALASGRQLLPYSLLSLAMVSVTGATSGAIVGQHRSDQKSMLSLLGLATQFIVSAAFVGNYGLPALAWAQIAQNAVVIAVGWFLFLKNHYGVWMFRLPVHWQRALCRELIGFGMKLQAVSIAQMLYDPAVKFLLSSQGGLKMVGFYEMAQRLVLQTRQVVVVPNQTLVPGFAHIMEAEPQNIGPFYHKAMAFSMLFGVPLLSMVALASPVISYLWVGHVEPTFVILVVMLSAGWGMTLVSVPAYLMGLGTGRVKWNVIAAIVTTSGACIFGFMAGHLLGGFGVAAAACTMLAVGAAFNLVMNCRDMGIDAFPHREHFRAAFEHALVMLRLKAPSQPKSAA